MRSTLSLIALVLLLAGCRPGASPPTEVETSNNQALPLRLLVVDDEALATVMERQWNARSVGPVEVSQISAETLLGQDTRRLGADAIVYRSGLIGELAARQWIAPIDDSELQNPQLNRRDIFSLARLREGAWGERIYAVPFGSPQLTIQYRRDLLEQAGLEPPVNWADYLKIAQQLQANADTNGQEWHAVAEPLAEGWAGQVLLARAAAYARHRSQFSTLFDSRSMDPLIAGPPFVRALEELIEANKLGPDNATELDPAAIREGLAAGRFAMGLTWPTRAEADDDTEPAAALSASGFAELPGSREVYNFRVNEWEEREETDDGRVTLLGVSGRMGSVTRECRQPHAALNLLFWLCGADMSSEISPVSPHTTLFRNSHTTGVAAWVDPRLDAEAGGQYATAVVDAQNRSTWLSSLRIPGRGRYLAALDQAVHAAVVGQSSAAEALQTAADEWQRITSDLGLEAQQQAYLRSIGLEP